MKRYMIGFMLLLAATFCAAQSDDESPLVFLTSQAKDKLAASDQKQALAEEFAKGCPNVQLAEVASDADYRVRIQPSEDASSAQGQQLVVNDPWGSRLNEVQGSSIAAQVKGACSLILADWSDQPLTREKYIGAINDGFRKDGLAGSAEIVGDNLIVHSERANRMRFNLLLANHKTAPLLKRAGFAMFIYTNDARENYAYDVKSGAVNENYDMKLSGKAPDSASKSGTTEVPAPATPPPATR